MHYSKIITFLVVSFILSSCNSGEVTKTIDKEKVKRGLALIETNCFTCHSPNGSMEERLGPPMAGIKHHYIDDKSTLESFTKDLKEYVLNPKEENVKMAKAVKKFGMMPKMDFESSKLEDIAYYIYHSKLEEPKWFKDHLKDEMNGVETEGDEMSYAKKGRQIALATKKVLGKNLMGTINKEGTAAALEFCNVNAMGLVAKMAKEQNAGIKRVTDAARNPLNKANAKELDYISEIKALLAKGEDLKPRVVESESEVVAYYPIKTNKMCLQCHGAPEKDIKPEVMTQIKKLYPEDKATRYAPNQIRGIWVVNMKK